VESKKKSSAKKEPTCGKVKKKEKYTSQEKNESGKASNSPMNAVDQLAAIPEN